ncbi:MAG: phosphopantothenoylcysteine decarboxylase [Planctomycetota bacterium]|nr:phosphopantothenoylcysteine decarboxylase [Planctomycetota bacterium]
MARILITSGPTRQFLDPVRYLTNASSGRMGCALAEAALAQGHEVVVVSGPVGLDYPEAASIVPVLTTDEMLAAAQECFPSCDGMIAAAAPCDYRPRKVQTEKISKSGEPLRLELVETSDIVATVAENKRPGQWIVGFALESEDQRFRAIVKMQKKCCDMMVSNGPSAIDSHNNSVELLRPDGETIAFAEGSKSQVAARILSAIRTEILAKS